MSRNKVLVTGAGGFIGRHLIVELLRRGRRVVAMVRPGRSLPPDIASSVERLEAEIGSWKPKPGALAEVETVFHLAGQYTGGMSGDLLEHLRKVNVEGTRNALNAALESGVSRFIHFSSIAAGDAFGAIMNEADKARDTSAYGISKRESEQILKRFDDGKINWTILRPVVVFGEGSTGPIMKIARALRSNRFVLVGDGRNRMSFVYVDDLVAAALHAESDERTYGHTFVISDEPIEFAKLVTLLEGIMSCRTRLRIPKWLGWCGAKMGDFLALVSGREMPLNTIRFENMTLEHAHSGKAFSDRTGFTLPIGLRAGVEKSLASAPRDPVRI